MGQKTQRASLMIVLCSGLFLLGTILLAVQENTLAQENPQVSCEANLAQVYTVASDVCIGGPEGHICNGGASPFAEPTGPVSNSLAATGALVQADMVDMLNTIAIAPDGSHGGLAWMRVAETQTRILMVGNVLARDVTPSDLGFPDWTAMVVQTSENQPHCTGAAYSAFVIQNTELLTPSRVVINGASMDLAGTVMVQTRGDQTLFISLEGQARILANGQTQRIVAGQQLNVGHSMEDYSIALGAPSAPYPLDATMLTNFPMQLLDRPVRLPQPGFVSTQGEVNMRTAPSTDADVMALVPGGETLTILGRNPAGDWYHVRLSSNGLTGWMFGNILQRNHGEITSVYSNTPVPPQRFGQYGTKAVVIAPAGVTLREAPDAAFDPLYDLATSVEVDLIARSPYSPWVKVDAGSGIIGWVALITLETQSIIESLPVDYEVPPQPTQPPPTIEPGSWGGAFPDPDCFPNC